MDPIQALIGIAQELENFCSKYVPKKVYILHQKTFTDSHVQYVTKYNLHRSQSHYKRVIFTHGEKFL